MAMQMRFIWLQSLDNRPIPAGSHRIKKSDPFFFFCWPQHAMHLERPQSIAVIDRRRISALKETQAEALRGVPLRFIIISGISADREA